MPATTIEVARYAASDDDALLAARPDMVRAIRERFPGLLHAILARTDDGDWLDVFVWDSEAHARDAVAGEGTLPEYRRFARHIAAVRFSEVAVGGHAG